MKKFFRIFLPVISIYPVLTAVFLLSSLASKGAVNALFWFIPPSILLEQMLETKFPVAADNILLNLIFIFLYWGLISLSVVYSTILSYKLFRK